MPANDPTILLLLKNAIIRAVLSEGCKLPLIGQNIDTLQSNRLLKREKFQTGDTDAEQHAQSCVPLFVFRLGFFLTASGEIEERPFLFFIDCEVWQQDEEEHEKIKAQC